MDGAEDDTPGIHRSLIIGWVIGPLGRPTPIAPGCDDLSDITDGDAAVPYIIEVPDGHYQHAVFDGSPFDTLEACIAEVRRRLREGG